MYTKHICTTHLGAVHVLHAYTSYEWYCINCCGLHVETHQWSLILKSWTFTMPSSLINHHIISNKHTTFIFFTMFMPSDHQQLHSKRFKLQTLLKSKSCVQQEHQMMLTWKCNHYCHTNHVNRNTNGMMLAFPLMLLFIVRNDELLLRQIQITINKQCVCPSWRNHMVILFFQLESEQTLM